MTSVLDRSVEGPTGLVGGVCGGCGFVFFPDQRYGCERCGRHGDDLRARTLAGRGTVLAATVVKLHADPRRTAPFTVLRLRLDDGPVVRAVAVDGAEVAVGGRVEAVLVPIPEGADELLGLRFAPELAGGCA
ncbi:MAG TPA: OB-fold domain-containing protein [Pseudonocardia sp.]|jgi:hypothetical protein|nr:OB-fold domain-containing protein [Pseudonocardia sp.]